MIGRLVILGATGDLTGRYLLPALARLGEGRLLPDDFAVHGLARDRWDTARFRAHAADQLRRHDAPPAAVDALLRALHYGRADVTRPAELQAVVGGARVPAVFYLALPPTVAGDAIEAVASLRPPEGSRIVVEKPFGTGLESARALNRLLRRHFDERAVFRLDHFLGKETLLNILGLRFANRFLEPVWSRQHVERVEISWDETLALEGRAGYYDSAGALRDMVQNHLLQILCLVAMEPPLGLGERDLRDRKVDLLRAVRKLDADEVARCAVRARYTAGRAGGRPVPAYVDEPGVEPARNTETFAQVTLAVDNWRWAGVPFVLRSGKGLARDRREIVVRFHEVPHLPFGEGPAPAPNVLRIQLSPDRMSLLANVSSRRRRFELEALELDADLAAEPLPAYARLLLDVLAGDPTLSIRADEAEESWRIVEPILATWAADRVPLLEYPAGTSGPPGAPGSPG